MLESLKKAYKNRVWVQNLKTENNRCEQFHAEGVKAYDSIRRLNRGNHKCDNFKQEVWKRLVKLQQKKPRVWEFQTWGVKVFGSVRDFNRENHNCVNFHIQNMNTSYLFTVQLCVMLNFYLTYILNMD